MLKKPVLWTYNIISLHRMDKHNDISPDRISKLLS